MIERSACASIETGVWLATFNWNKKQDKLLKYVAQRSFQNLIAMYSSNLKQYRENKIVPKISIGFFFDFIVTFAAENSKDV